jgi:hypothetical protein
MWAKSKVHLDPYLSPEPQLLFLLTLCIFFLCVLYTCYFALVEACEVFFARCWVEGDVFRSGDVDLALLGGRRHVCATCVVLQRVAYVYGVLVSGRLRRGCRVPKIVAGVW